MLQKVGSISRVVEGISKDKIFNLWVDVNNWHKFNHGIEYAKLEGEFKVGNYFILGLTGGQKVKVELFEVTTNQSFTDVTKFPFARMYGIHEIIEHDGGLQIRVTIKIEGILSFLWKKLVAQSVADKLGDDMDSLIALAKV